MLWFVELAPESSVDIVQAMTTSGALVQSATFNYMDGCCADITSGPTRTSGFPRKGVTTRWCNSTRRPRSCPYADPQLEQQSRRHHAGCGRQHLVHGRQPGYGRGVTGNIDVIKLPNLNLINILYLPNRSFVPNEVNLPQEGDTASWLGLNPKINSITDASGMGLFGSQDSPSTIDSTYSFAFTGAGTHIYRGGAGGTGKVAVPITAQLQPGTTDKAEVTWASASPLGGFAFDVEVRTPGSHSFVSWQAGATATSGTLGPLSGPYTGPGTYQFRSRVRNTGSGAASGYSAPASITLT